MYSLLNAAGSRQQQHEKPKTKRGRKSPFQKKVKMDTIKKYPLYKGLQRPLVFKMFRGKFIYYAAAVVAGGVVVAGLVTAIISSVIGLIVLFATTVPGLLWVLKQQKSGLFSKKRDRCIVIYKPKDRKA
jgi:hypothetical protein